MTLGTTVLIPSMFVNQMGGSNVEKAKVIQTLLFVSGLNTLMQSLFGTRLPSVIGGSYAFVIPMTSILHAERYHLSSPEPNGDYCTYHKFERTMRGMQGALIVASCFQMLIGFLGLWRNVVSYPSFYGSSHDFYWTWAILSWFSNATQASCRIDHAGLITGVPWLYIPYPFQWGRPTFQAGEAFAMMAVSLESTGTFLATARYGSATPVPASVLKGYKQDNLQRSNLQVKKIYGPVHDYIFRKGELH